MSTQQNDMAAVISGTVQEEYRSHRSPRPIFAIAKDGARTPMFPRFFVVRNDRGAIKVAPMGSLAKAVASGLRTGDHVTISGREPDRAGASFLAKNIVVGTEGWAGSRSNQ